MITFTTKHLAYLLKMEDEHVEQYRELSAIKKRIAFELNQRGYLVFWNEEMVEHIKISGMGLAFIAATMNYIEQNRVNHETP